MRRSHPFVICLLASLLSVTAYAQGKVPATEVVDIKAAGGVTLKASYFPAGRPGPAILLLHACNKDRSSWTKLATDAAAQGFHVLALDFRGFGESGGPRFTQGPEQQSTIDLYWPGDVDAALAWLIGQSQVDKTRIGAAGASCGVNQAVQLALRHPEVKTVVLLSGAINPAGRLYLRDSPWLPVLAAASDGDGGAVDQMRWALGWSRNPSNKFVEYKAAGHGTDMFAVEKGLEPLVVGWFNLHLRNAPAKPLAMPPSPPSPTEQFWTTLTAPGGVAKARQIYDEAKREKKRGILFPENETNLLGYQLLQDGSAKEAVEVFKLNVDAYPGSANTYDSLSDGYLALGNREEALRYAEKAIEMLPKDAEAPDNLKTLVRESAEKKIKELKK
jgi:pimeloyl-ACP methyl ester carboxylesterase